MAKIEYEEIVNILYGATFFGGGGGGPYSAGIKILNSLDKAKQSIEIVNLNDTESGSYSVMAAGLGSPKSLGAATFGPEAAFCVQGMIEEAKRMGHELKYIYSGEMGGFNTMVPLYAAALLGIPVLDLDGQGRAVPELNTSLQPIYQINISPLVLANREGDIIIGRLRDPLDSVAAETIARQMCMAYNNSIGFSTWMMSKEDHKRVSVIGQLSLAGKIGKILRDPNLPAGGLVEELKKHIKIKQFAEGTITAIDGRTEQGFDFGVTTIKTDDDDVFEVSFKNENMFIRNQGKMLLTIPEIITLVNSRDKTPLTNAETELGQRVYLLGVKVSDQWWKAPEGWSCWEKILKLMGYTGPAVKIS
jgi:DUF917 family protein